MVNIVINAGPGTGKTYTIANIPRFLRTNNEEAFLRNVLHTEEQRRIWETVKEKVQLEPGDKILYAAYNADLVREAKSKIAKGGPFPCECKTVHGVGYSILINRYRFLKVNDKRGIQIVERLTGEPFRDLEDRFIWLSALKYSEKLKEELLPPEMESVHKLREKYDTLLNYSTDPILEEYLSVLLKEMKIVRRKEGVEFIDQVWLPLFIVKKPIYKLGLIDEAQDFSAARLALITKVCENIVWVGDPDQAINAFAGADPEAFEKIERKANIILPLKTSFRCPKKIVQMANKIIANRIIPRREVELVTKNEEEGEVQEITYSSLPRKVKPGDMIICRYNAPLIAAAFMLTRNKIPVKMLGKSLCDQLISIVKSIRAKHKDQFISRLLSWAEMSKSRANKYLKEVIDDKVQCIILAAKEVERLEELPDFLKELFNNKEGEYVELSTIHKAKGREAKRVFILFPPVESDKAETPEQKQQERNLSYVAITRTKHSLFFVGKDR